MSSAISAVGGFLTSPGGGALVSAGLGALTSSRAASQAREGAQQAGRLSGAQAALGRGDISAFLPRTLAELTTGAEQAAGQLEPIADVGGAAFTQQAALSGALGPEAQQQAIAEFQASPGQQFLQQEAEQASLRGAAATGGLGGGRIRQELQRQAIGFGSQNLQNRFSQLGQIGGQGIQARTNIANLLSSLGSARAGAQQAAGTGLANIAVGQAAPQANLALQAAQARAAGTLGLGSAAQQGLGGLASGGFFSGLGFGTGVQSVTGAPSSRSLNPGAISAGLAGAKKGFSAGSFIGQGLLGGLVGGVAGFGGEGGFGGGGVGQPDEPGGVGLGGGIGL